MFRKILTILTLILVGVVVWGAHEEILDAVNYLANTNLFFIILLVPEQLFMYYCSGMIYFSYLAAKIQGAKSDSQTLLTDQLVAHPESNQDKTDVALVEGASSAQASSETTTKSAKTTVAESSTPHTSALAVKNYSPWLLTRISFELNFVNNAMPSGGFAGLGYITWRFRIFGATAGQVSFMYILRYVITILANQAQTIVAVVILMLIGGIKDGSWWVIWMTSAVCLGIIAVIAGIIFIASSKKRITWFAKPFTKFVNGVTKAVTFGHKPEVLQYTKVESYLLDIYKDVLIARQNKKILIRPAIWGAVYSFLEIATYWLVAISMGHVEILPQIMIAEAVASVIGAVMLTPGGVGGYEGSMIFLMSALGVDAGLATAVVISTRVIVLLGTIVSGYGFYQSAISKIGKKERAKIMHEVGE